MPRSPLTQVALEDALQTVEITDFSGGLQTIWDKQDCPLNASPDCADCYVEEDGSLSRRAGYAVLDTVIVPPIHGHTYFIDNNSDVWNVVWAGGNVYAGLANDSIGVTGQVATGVYSPDPQVRITYATLFGKLYYSDGVTTYSSGSGIRVFDGYTDSELISSEAPGSVPPPRSRILLAYNGQLVSVPANSTNIFAWSNVGDPTTWLGTSMQAVGLDRSAIGEMVPFGLSAQGIVPDKRLCVLMRHNGVYALSGPLGATGEAVLPVDSGIAYRPGYPTYNRLATTIPLEGGKAWVVFAGQDQVIWATDGIQVVELSRMIANRVKPVPMFYGLIRYPLKHQLLVDVETTHDKFYVFDYRRHAWFRFRMGKPALGGLQAVAMASHPRWHWLSGLAQSGETVKRVDFFEAGANPDTDNGAPIKPYWYTPLLYGVNGPDFRQVGNKDSLKVYKWVYASFRTDTSNLIVTAITDHQSGPATETLKATEPGAYAAQYDVSLFDIATFSDLLPDGTRSVRKKGRLTITNPKDQSLKESLRGFDCQLRLGTDQPGIWQVYSVSLKFVDRGSRRVRSTDT